MKTIFDHLRECAGNGDMPTLDAEDAQQLVETYDELLGALQPFVIHNSSAGLIVIEVRTADVTKARKAIKRATESRPLRIGRG